MESVLVNGGVPGYTAPCYVENIRDTITEMTVVGHMKNYKLIGIPLICSDCMDGLYPCPSINDTGTFSFSDLVYPIVDTSFIPESGFVDFTYSHGYIFYFPDDTQFCLHTPLYRPVPIDYFTGTLGGSFGELDYKMGIGETYNYYFDGNPTYASVQLIYASGVGCDGPLNVKDATMRSNSMLLYPNPAQAEFVIESPEKLSRIEITNIFGQTVYSGKCNDKRIEINISELSPGIYFAKVRRADGYEAVKKFVKE